MRETTEQKEEDKMTDTQTTTTQTASCKKTNCTACRGRGFRPQSQAGGPVVKVVCQECMEPVVTLEKFINAYGQTGYRNVTIWVIKNGMAI